MSTPPPNPPQQPAPPPNSPQQPAPVQQTAPAQQSNRPVRTAKKQEGLKESTRQLKAASDDRTPFLARMFSILPFFQPFLLLLGVAALVLLAWPIYGLYQDAQANDNGQVKTTTDPGKDLKSNLGEIQVQIQSRLDKEAGFLEEMKLIRSERDELRGEKKGLNKNVSDLNLKLAKLEQEKKQLNEKYEREREQSKESQNQLNELNKLLNATKDGKDTLSTLRMQIVQLEEKVGKYEQVRKQYEEQHKLAIAAYKKSEMELARSKEQNNLLSIQVDELEKARDGLFAQLNRLFVTEDSAKVSPFVEEAAKQLTSVVDQKFNLRLQNQMKKLGEIDLSIQALQSTLGRRARKENVALIVYDSTRIRSEKYTSIVKQLIEKNYDATVYANYDWGVYTATTGKVLVQDAPLALGENPSRTLVNLNVPSNTGQEPDVSGTDPKQIFTAPPVADTKRRCILVLPSDAKAPDANDQNWKDLQVDVVLVADATQPEQVSRTIADQWLKWHNFCRLGGGEAVLVPIKVQSRELSDDSKEAIRLRLERLLHPRHS